MQEITQVRSAATALVTYMVQMKARGALSGEFSAGSSAKLYAAIRSMAAFSKVVAEHEEGVLELKQLEQERLTAGEPSWPQPIPSAGPDLRHRPMSAAGCGR